MPETLDMYKNDTHFDHLGKLPKLAATVEEFMKQSYPASYYASFEDSKTQKQLADEGKEVAKHFDSGKPDLTLLSILPEEPLIEIAKVMQMGAKKYGMDNWKGGMPWRRITASTCRHIWAFLRGQDNDTESGLHHLAHAGCDILFCLWYVLKNVGEDDRNK